MDYNYHEIRFPSSDGKNTVYAEIYEPTSNPVGIIQISHGMVDHIGRYKGMAEFFVRCGYVVAGNHHLGHGKTAACPEDFGYFAKKGGVDYLVADLKAMNDRLKERYPNAPHILLGHSMGSFLARLYAVKHPDTLDAVIIHGTGGKNPLIPMGKLVANLNILFCGRKNRSKLITLLALGSYNKRFPKEEGRSAWLTREGALVADRRHDEYAGFIFTTSAYKDLFKMLSESNKSGWYSAYPKNKPTLVVSGDMDPVGNFGAGVREVYEGLNKAGCDVSLKLYEGARHELFNETNRFEVFDDLLSFIRKAVK